MAKGEKAHDVVTCLSFSIVVVGLDAAECKYAAQLVPDAVVSTALLVGEATTHLLSVPPVIVQELGFTLEHHARVRRHLLATATELVPVRFHHWVRLVVPLVVSLDIETVVKITTPALLLDRRLIETALAASTMSTTFAVLVIAVFHAGALGRLCRASCRHHLFVALAIIGCLALFILLLHRLVEVAVVLRVVFVFKCFRG